MKKKLSLILMLCFMVLGLAACGDPTTQDYYGMTYNDLQSLIQSEVTTLVNADGMIDTNGNEIAEKLVTAWDDAVTDLGAFEGFGKFTITTAQDTMTLEQYVEFEGREVSVTYVYEYNYQDERMELTDANADLVYTMGEKMAKAGLNTLMGMGTVFAVLIFISFLISLFKYIPAIQNVFGKKKDAAS